MIEKQQALTLQKGNVLTLEGSYGSGGLLSLWVVQKVDPQPFRIHVKSAEHGTGTLTEQDLTRVEVAQNMVAMPAEPEPEAQAETAPESQGEPVADAPETDEPKKARSRKAK